MTRSAPPGNPDAVLTFISPLKYATLPTGGARVAQLDYEGSVLPAEWVEYALTFIEHVVVPSTFNRDTLVQSGLSRDMIDVVPYGFDHAPSRLRTGVLPARANGSSCSSSEPPARHKGLDILLAAIESAFSPNEKISLRIHIVDYPDMHTRPYLDHDWRTRVERARTKGYPVEVTTTVLLDDGMSDLHRSADLVCHTFRAESFCIRLVEGMACGTPILATACGGLLDCLDSGVGFPSDDYEVVRGGTMLLDNRVRTAGRYSVPRASRQQSSGPRDQREQLNVCDGIRRLSRSALLEGTHEAK